MGERGGGGEVKECLRDASWTPLGPVFGLGLGEGGGGRRRRRRVGVGVGEEGRREGC